MQPQYAVTFTDLREGILAWPLWGRLGWRDTRLRYTRTALGPFWTTLSLGIFVSIMGVLWSSLWHMDVKSYLPFLTSGLVTWMFISSLVIESCGTFLGYDTLVKQLRVPYAMLACSVVWRNMLIFVHNLIIYALVSLFCGVSLTWATLLFVPALFLLAVNGIWVALLLGLVCARFRDIQQLLQSIMQIAMFLTPVFWTPAQLQGRTVVLADYNLLYHFIQIVRAPLMGEAPSAWNWTMVLLATAIGWAVTIFYYSRFRRRLPYWL